MRSAGWTKSGEPAFVTFWTKVAMACFAGPSFHEGSGSPARAAAVMKTAAEMSATVVRARMRMAFIAVSSWYGFRRGNLSPAPCVSFSIAASSEKLPAFWPGANSRAASRGVARVVHERKADHQLTGLFRIAAPSPRATTAADQA